MNLQAIIPHDAIIQHDQHLVTSSIKVAEAFGKEHKNVTQKIRGLDCSAQFLTANFSAVKYHHNGNEYEAFEITKDGHNIEGPELEYRALVERVRDLYWAASDAVRGLKAAIERGRPVVWE